ncbi:MAG: hypothetical protein CFK52_09195 [Chloracidobacterium sp. CP2_5A]|nr:MAG: hypothetical protein CFK52_09195 [Chloracidobacterium sp. CP2_5A]
MVRDGNGLLRYDGYGFKAFRREERQPDSLNGNLAYALREARAGALGEGEARALCIGRDGAL